MRKIGVVVRAGAVVLALLACSSCQFLQNEFTTLDRPAPSVHTAGVSMALPW